jgi:protein-S-isoprenylcysteine O-methyltransferase Ste14
VRRLLGIVRWEEQRLLSRFGGGDHRAYLAEVPRWVPRPPSAAKDPLPAH